MAATGKEITGDKGHRLGLGQPHLSCTARLGDIRYVMSAMRKRLVTPSWRNSLKTSRKRSDAAPTARSSYPLLDWGSDI